MQNTNKKSIVSIWNRNFICVLLTSFMLSAAHFSVNPLVASYALYMGASALVMGLLTGLFFGVALSMRPVTGPVMTKFDKRKLMIMVFVLGGAVNIGYALFHNIPAFIVFRFFHGVQYSIVGALLMTVAGDSLPKGKMASGMGIYGLSGSVGMAIGPTVGINLLNFGTSLRNESFGFTCIFLFAMVVSFLAVIPSYILTPDNKSTKDKLSTGAWYKNIASVYALPLTAVMFFIFIGWALYNVYIVEYAKELGITGISAFYTVLAVGLVFTRPVSGWLTDKFGLSKVLLPAMVLFAVSFVVVGYSRSIGTMLVASAIAAVGFGALQPALFSMCILIEPPLKRSVASNTLYIGIDLGLFLGPVIGSFLYQMYDFSVMFKATSLIILTSLVVFVISLPAYQRRRNVLEMMDIG